MSNREYDEIIDLHYASVAKEAGLAATSTMPDEITRQKETDAIVSFVDAFIRDRESNSSSVKKLTIMDIGCGNGFTLLNLSNKYPRHDFIGIEKSDDLRALACSRFSQKNNVQILKGDIREKNFANNIQADILISQRVLINLLDLQDQQKALANLIEAVKSPDNNAGGGLLFIECLSSSLMRLNEARAEFNMSPLPPAHHNLYLPDNFFETPLLKKFSSEFPLPKTNFLSTHYYVTRVLHQLFTESNKPFKRNSEFVRFFTAALNETDGDYSPLKLYLFEKS